MHGFIVDNTQYAESFLADRQKRMDEVRIDAIVFYSLRILQCFFYPLFFYASAQTSLARVIRKDKFHVELVRQSV